MFFAQKLSLNRTNSGDEKTLFEGLDLSLSSGDKLFLIGGNGSGKSSLLQILSKRILPTEGKLVAWPEVTEIFYLPQTYEEQFLSDELELELWQYIERSIEGWWGVMIFINSEFGRDIIPTTKVKDLSGGEIFQVLMALGILKGPSLVILDEPTNHIDHELKLKLAAILKSLKIPMIVASHDEYFIDAVGNRILELKDAAFREFRGQYTEYQKQLQDEASARERNLEALNKESAKLKVALDRASQRAQKVKARGERAIRENDNSIPKIVRHAYRSWAQVQHGKKSGDLEKKLIAAEDEKSALKLKERRIYIDLDSKDSRNSLIVDYRESALKTESSNRLLINSPEIKIYFGQRILLTGQNGVGKSTLLDAIREQIVREEQFKIFVLDQKYEVVSLNSTVRQNFAKVDRAIDDQSIFRYLAQFDLIDKVEPHFIAGELSGGQIAKVAFIMLLIANPDILIMDEPTNNLDIQTVKALKEALSSYKGAFIAVTHDQSFAEQLHPTHVYKIENRRLYDTMRAL